MPGRCVVFGQERAGAPWELIIISPTLAKGRDFAEMVKQGESKTFKTMVVREEDYDRGKLIPAILPAKEKEELVRVKSTPKAPAPAAPVKESKLEKVAVPEKPKEPEDTVLPVAEKTPERISDASTARLW